VERLPLFERKIVKKLAEQHLDAIALALKNRVEHEPDPGFMTGLAGQALFFYSYARSSGQSRYENLGFLALERALAMVNNGFSWPSFAAGLAGMRFTLKYLATRGHISESDGAALDDIDPCLNDFAKQRFANGDYDFLHGAIGMYLREQRYPQEDFTNAVKSVVIPAKAGTPSLTATLASLAISPGPGFLSWETRHPQTGTPEINLGLAHGIPSVLWMLSHQEPDPERNNLLKGGVNYLLSCRMQDTANGSIFPHRIVNGVPDQPGRLAWCYGDPGVGAALWQIGLNCNRPDWQTDAIGILHNAASRRDSGVNRVHDACICHGTAGLALIFYKMAILTGHDELLDAAGHWARATLDHGQKPDAAAGYLFLTTGDHYISSWSLLEGITGVGLTLLALLDADTLGWEQGLML